MIDDIARPAMASCPPANSRLELGFKADGTQAFDYYRPSLPEFAADMVKAEWRNGQNAAVHWNVSIPLPSGMSIRKAEKQALLALSDTHAIRFRRVYGYAGEIKCLQEKPGDAITCETPAVVQAVIKLWWRYFPMRGEASGSSLIFRALAFASCAAFGERLQVIRAGGPISGIVEATDGKHHTAQLTGWAPATAAEWELRSPRTLPDSGFELNGDALAALPSLAKDNFAHYHAPNVPYARLLGPKEPKYLTQVVGPSDDPPAVRTRARPTSPRTSPDRRMRDRYRAQQAARRAEALTAAAKASRHAPRAKAPPTTLPPYLLRGLFYLRGEGI